EVEVVGPQPAERLVEHFQREVPAAAMGADLGHEEDAVAAAVEAAAEPVFGPAVPVFPAVVEKGHAAVDRFVNEADRVIDGLQVAQMMTAEAQRGDGDAGATERPLRNCVGHGIPLPEGLEFGYGSKSWTCAMKSG